MPRQPAARAAGQLRRMTWSVVCVLPLCSVPAGVLAQNVPAGLRACAAETDSARRLACYDREMARLSQPPPVSQPPAPPAAAPVPSKPDLAPGAATTAAVSAPTSTPAPPPPAAATPQTPAPPAPHHSWVGKIFGGGASSRVTARIASMDRSANAMVLRLDNGQVWQQIGRATGDLTLQAGDSVTIEKHLGSYWLSANHVSDMQVRLKPQ